MTARRRPIEVLRQLGRFPFTGAVVIVLGVVAILTGTHITPLSHLPWFDDVATGLPAIRNGRWWTVATSPWFAVHPLRLLVALPLTAVAVGWAEATFGTLRAAALFVAGHLAGVLGTAATIALVSARGNAWATELSTELVAGPSAGALVCLIFAAATLSSPWRLRVRFAVGAWAIIGLVYVGQLLDVERAVVVITALLVSGFLPSYRHPLGRPTLREWRLLGSAWLIVIAVVEVFDLLPFNGPFGSNVPFLPAIDVLLDVVAIAILAQAVRVGMRAAWIATIAMSSLNIAMVLAFGNLLEDTGHLMSVAMPSAVLWAVQLGIMLLGRGAFQVRFRRRRRALGLPAVSEAELRRSLQEFGGENTSWMATWRDNQWAEAGGGVFAFHIHAGVALMLGDPIVPREGPQSRGALAGALAEFATSAERAGVIPCVFSASERSAAARPTGWRQAVIAEDTIVDLAGLTFSGKRWNSVRTSLNKAEREGITFRLCRLRDEPRAVLTQIRALSEQWAGDKGLPEMRFTLGTVEEALDPEVLVGIAVDQDGTLHGVTSWLPVYGAGGIVRGRTLDLMRRRDDGFGPVMEFLIGSAALEFAAEGVEFVSLSGAPLMRPDGAVPSPVERVLDRIGEIVEPLYGFRSLHRFKQKFHPRSEPLYLLYRDEGDLPRIAVGLTRAYLPDASLGDLLASATDARSG